MCRKLCFLIVFVGLFLAGVAQAVPDPNAYYKLDESFGNIASDSSGNKHDGTLYADVNWVPAGGQIGGAARFFDTEDDDDQIRCPNDILNNQEGVITLWGYVTAGDAADERHLFSVKDDVGNRIQLYMGSGQGAWLSLGIGDSHIKDVSFINLGYNQWKHVALTWEKSGGDPNSGTYRIYVNKVSATTGSYAGLGPVSQRGPTIGNNGDYRTGDREQQMVGLIDEVGIWDVNMTADDVCDVYYGGVPQKAFDEATEPSPGRGDTDVPITASLVWVAGTGATSHDVYLGNEVNDYNDVNDATTGTAGIFKGNQAGTTYAAGSTHDPCGLAVGTTYYWRIDERGSFYKGDVWSFTTDLGQATDPYPEDEEDNIPPTVVLQWKPSLYATAHEVYLGTVFEDVNSATDPNTEPGEGRQDPNEFDPGGLDLGTTYYWRIDEVNSVLGTVKGEIWQFEVYRVISIDDFEGYDNSAALQAVWSKAQGAYWRNLVVPPPDEEQGDDTNKSMEVLFNNGVGNAYVYAEVYRDPAPRDDFTSEGMTAAMAMWYRSKNDVSIDPNEDPNGLYIQLTDDSANTKTKPASGADPNWDGEWHEWNIDLKDFNGVDLNNVAELRIGLGDGVDHDHWGYIYFDEIRLYAPRCLPDILQPEGDLDDDCDVDFEDVENMGGMWLEHDYNSVGADGFLYNTDDAIPGFVSPSWVGDPCRGRALHFGGRSADPCEYVDPPDYAGICHQPSGPNSFQLRTICFWVKNHDDQLDHPVGYTYRARLFETHSDYWIEMSVDGGDARPNKEGMFRMQLADDDNAIKYNLHTTSVFTVDEWHHAAAVINNHYDAAYEDPGPNMVSVDMYFDGVQIKSGIWCEDTGHGGDEERITRHEGDRLRGTTINGTDTHTNCFIEVTMDEFRIYDHNMVAADVCDIYMGIDGAVPGDPNLLVWYEFDELSGIVAEDSGRNRNVHFYYPLDTSANLVEKDPEGAPYDPANEDIVNFVDYAVLADTFGEETLWPPE